MTKGIPPGGQNFELCAWRFPVLGRKNGQVCSYVLTYLCGQWFGLMVRDVEGT